MFTTNEVKGNTAPASYLSLKKHFKVHVQCTCIAKVALNNKPVDKVDP